MGCRAAFWSTRMVAVLRGTPFLIQLFILYYGGPFMGLDLDPLTAGILGLAIYGSAYFAVIFTSGFASVPKGQNATLNTCASVDPGSRYCP